MLGKLIKNEFVQRGRNVCLLWLLALGMSVFNLIVSNIINVDIGDNAVLFEGMVYITTILVLVGSFAMVVATGFMDYNTRFFKDQGYLTHTLPVKTESILFARIVGDLVIAALTAVLYPTFVCIAMGDFEFWMDVLDFLSLLFNNSDMDYMVIFILTIILVMFSFLTVMWHYYASYAMGHSFRSGKRALSIIIYIGLYLLGMGIVLATDEPINEIYERLDFNGLNEIIFSMVVTIVYSALATVICFLITDYTCKKRLNLE